MKKKLFTLTRRNQKGQVAIFVALIFQVVFIFFAILINIGLLVHHKINLQQSTDLAAYYGAMKQSELMNAIAHVNFQMRQAWKLLTWRYRIVGTFGFQASARGGQEAMIFPLRLDLSGVVPTAYTGIPAENTKCSATGVNILDVPFFCGGHSGFGDWTATNENNCRIDCGHVDGTASTIASVPLTGGYDNPFTGGVAGAVNAALTQANNQIANLCEALGPTGFASVAKYIIAYGAEVQKKKKLIQMLGADLSADPANSRDLNGGLILDGAKKTFDNNLTEANLTGKISFSTLNGLTQGGECGFEGAASDGADANAKKQFLKEIKFQGIQFFIHQCQVVGGAANKDFKPISMYTDGTLQVIAPSLFPSTLSATDRTNLQNAIIGTEFILGYEKNPWCQVYYAAKSQAEPKIPFLPLSKIRLSAVSVAKPFGGTIGPRYNAVWPLSNPTSSGGAKVDETLPERKFSGVPPGPPLVQYQRLIPNYANYVGDTKGLKDAWVAGSYQDIMLHRQLTADITELNISRSKDPSPVASHSGLQMPPPTGWPAAANWNGLADPSSTTYDYLARARAGSGNSFLRDLEIAVIAPNQFDLNYYSIDPDFYNNYYLKIKGGVVGPMNFTASYNNLLNVAHGNGPKLEEINPDFGYNATLEGANTIAKNYSVRHQIAVAARVLKAAVPVADGGRPFTETFRFNANKPSSVLTGWTFQDFSSYVDSVGANFPNTGPDLANTMTFGKCSDAGWNNTADTAVDKIFDSPVSTGFPPTPGNCVTGGRTGYSVKLVSPSMLRAGATPQDYGGGGATGNILNQIDNTFFTF